MARDEIKKSEKQVDRARGKDTRGMPTFIPQIDIYEDPNNITVIADMPGVDKDGVNINLEDDQLTISGKLPSPGESGTILHREYEVGNYFRQFTLSDVIDREKISAKISDGVLTVTLPKTKAAVPRKIEVTS